MLFRPMTRNKRLAAFISCVIAILLLIVWAVKCYGVNAKAFRSEVEIYQTGEFVPLDGDFITTSEEDTAGYSIRVNKAYLVDYTELMNSYEAEITKYGLFPIHTYCLMVEVTVKNEGNESGYIDCLGLNAYNGALKVPVDYEVWRIIDENFKSTQLRLRPDSEATIILPYTAQLLDEAMNKKELNRRLEDETLLFCVSEFPTIKLIEVETKNGL